MAVGIGQLPGDVGRVDLGGDDRRPRTLRQARRRAGMVVMAMGDDDRIELDAAERLDQGVGSHVGSTTNVAVPSVMK